MQFPAALLLYQDDHLCGTPQAELIVVQYGDYHCAESRAAWLTLQAEVAQHPTAISAIYRHFPPLPAGGLPLGAAEAVECAAAQGQFWEMHNLLHQHREALEEGALVEYAAQLQLDVTRFLRDMSCRRFQTRVEQDLASGRVLGVTRAPTLWIGGQRLTEAEEKGLGETLRRLLLETYS